MKTIFVLNGPNLNLLGTRQPDIYGTTTLADVEAACIEHAKGSGVTIDFRQSNAEHVLIDWVHEARNAACAIVINPAAFTHTSVALLDALNTFDGPVAEVHLSNIHKREAFRHKSYVSMRADTVIAGAGHSGYLYALTQMIATLGAAR
ncbi:type II 3-dehydroquinate dehydratase [Sphingomonas sp. CLY1604]|uniref:type II 3-dehydroquinate dehydratase n=1 Tax=Sphingomonas sp. CLY1604 TaxID=3457786 RepID=UPI003FD875CE